MRRVISAESDQCGECKVETSFTDKALQCDMCGHWFNFNSSKVSGKIYEMLCKNEDDVMVLHTLSDKYPWSKETFEKAYSVGKYSERNIKNDTTF